MKLTKGMKKALSLLLSTALVVGGVNVTANKAAADEADAASKTLSWTGEAVYQDAGEDDGALKSITETESNGVTIRSMSNDIEGWAQGHMAVVEISTLAAFTAPQITVVAEGPSETVGDDTEFSVMEYNSWDEVFKVAAATNAAFNVQTGALNKEETMYWVKAPGRTVTAIYVHEEGVDPLAGNGSGEGEGGEGEGGEGGEGEETVTPGPIAENTARLSFSNQAVGWNDHAAPALDITEAGEYTMTVSEFGASQFTNLGFFGVESVTDIETITIAMQSITINGEYELVLKNTDDENGIDYSALNPKSSTKNGLANIWNPNGKLAVVAANADESATLGAVANEAGEVTGIAFYVGEEETEMDTIAYNFEVTELTFATGEGEGEGSGEGEGGNTDASPTPGASATVAPTVVPTVAPTATTAAVSTKGGVATPATIKLSVAKKNKNVVVAAGKSKSVKFTAKAQDPATQAAVVTATVKGNKKVTAKVDGSKVKISAKKKAVKGSKAKVVLTSTNASGASVKTTINVAVQNKAKKIKAAKKSVTIKKGKTAKVVIKVTKAENKKAAITDTVKATVKKVAKVTKTQVKKGKVIITLKAKKKGSAKLNVKVGAKKAKVNVKVK